MHCNHRVKNEEWRGWFTAAATLSSEKKQRENGFNVHVKRRWKKKLNLYLWLCEKRENFIPFISK